MYLLSEGRLPANIHHEDIATHPDEPPEHAALRDSIYRRNALRNAHYLWDRNNISFMISSSIAGM